MLAYTPGWQSWLTDEGRSTLEKGYLINDGGIKETQNCMFARVAKAAASYMPDLQNADEAFYALLTKGLLSLATPVAANLGTDRGLPVSCFAQHPANSIDSIFTAVHESAMLSKYGGGLGVYLGDLAGQSNAVQWAKAFDLVGATVSQGGGVRKGSVALYLPIDHPDIWPFLQAKELLEGDSREKLACNIAVVVPDSFMQSCLAGDKDAIKLFAKVLELRMKYGSPYILYIDNVTKADPASYAKLGLKTKTSNLCIEVTQHTDAMHTFVCVLSSLNVAKLDELKAFEFAGKSAIWWSIAFLDCVCEEFIQKSAGKAGMCNARRSAIKARPLGLGVIGWHTLLQDKLLAFDSPEAFALNKDLFEWLGKAAKQASRELGELLGASEWAGEYRNTHTMAIAPTTTNSVIGGGVSPGIEPNASNYNAFAGARGTFVRKNAKLDAWLKQYFASTSENPEQDLLDAWQSIAEHDGSVQHMQSLPMREVFRTAREISQEVIIRQAADRQVYIDQGQSLNLFLPPDISVAELWRLHFLAWKLGCKSLYYVRSQSKALQAVQAKGTDVPASIASCEMLTRDGCIFCERAKQLLHARGIAFTEIVKPDGKVPRIILRYTDNKSLALDCESLYMHLGETMPWKLEPSCLACEG